jgi:lipopolysaccharide export system protein LptA
LKARRSISAICLTLALPLAHGAEPAADPKPTLRKLPAISVLPDGSELEGVVLPRYDKKLRLTGSLHADKLTLVSSEVIRGEKVRIAMLDPDREDANIHVKLGRALLNQTTGMIHATEQITLESARFTATGTALHLEFETGRGYVSGPATTVIKSLPQTTMKTPSLTPGHPRTAMAALGVAVAASAVLHARPLPVSEAELAEVQAAAATRAAEVDARTAESRSTVEAARETSTEISTAARTFLVNQVLEPGQQPPAAEPPADGPLDDEAAPEDTRILSDGGFYFDAEQGVLVYLGNVRVTDPRFTLEGVDELKIIFAKKEEKKPQKETTGEKPPEKETAKEKDPAGGFAAGLGDVERVIATGRVRLNQKQAVDGEAPVEASGALFNYNVGSGEIILSGGYPWVRKGGYYARALQPNLNLRIQRNGSFVTEGQWEMKGRLDKNARP